MGKYYSPEGGLPPQTHLTTERAIVTEAYTVIQRLVTGQRATLHGRHVDVDDAVLAQRRVGWSPLAPRYTTGVLGKYAKLVGSAAQGAITG